MCTSNGMTYLISMYLGFSYGGPQAKFVWQTLQVWPVYNQVRLTGSFFPNRVLNAAILLIKRSRHNKRNMQCTWYPLHWFHTFHLVSMQRRINEHTACSAQKHIDRAPPTIMRLSDDLYVKVGGGGQLLLCGFRWLEMWK